MCTAWHGTAISHVLIASVNVSVDPVPLDAQVGQVHCQQVTSSLLSLECKPCIVGAADAAASLCCCAIVSACHLECHPVPWHAVQWHWLLPHLLLTDAASPVFSQRNRKQQHLCSEVQSLFTTDDPVCLPFVGQH